MYSPYYQSIIHLIIILFILIIIIIYNMYFMYYFMLFLLIINIFCYQLNSIVVNRREAFIYFNSIFIYSYYSFIFFIRIQSSIINLYLNERNDKYDRISPLHQLQSHGMDNSLIIYLSFIIIHSFLSFKGFCNLVNLMLDYFMRVY